MTIVLHKREKKIKLVSRQTDCFTSFCNHETNDYHPLRKKSDLERRRVCVRVHPGQRIMKMAPSRVLRRSLVSYASFIIICFWCFSWIGELAPAVASSFLVLLLFIETCSLLVLPMPKIFGMCMHVWSSTTFIPGKKIRGFKGFYLYFKIFSKGKYCRTNWYSYNWYSTNFFKITT